MLKFKVLLSVFFLASLSFAQTTSYRLRQLYAVKDSILLDSNSVYPNSIQIFCKNTRINPENYTYSLNSNYLKIKQRCSDTIFVSYRVFPFNLSQKYQSRDTSIIYKTNRPKDQFLLTQEDFTYDLFEKNTINKSGSISRGVTFGNSQNLSLNSSLNLELDGDLSNNLKIKASISDNNIPIQADGNTNKLQEFDQMFIQIYNNQMKLIAGDFWLYKPTGYFMTYKKRAQGLTFNYVIPKDTNKVWTTQTSGAISKGKFNRQIIQGIEGNQGPYRLTGAENEPYIIILAGTERIYIDGKLMERGQEFDYTIDYNTAEVTFTAKNLINKDKRIVVDFQYSDQNYARTLFQNSIGYRSDKMEFWFNTYSEQDAKNQSLQQTLSLSDKNMLKQIGDSVNLARAGSIDSIGFADNQIRYKLIDSLGYDSILVYSVNPDSAYFKAVFEFVGDNQGNYIFSNFNALGKVYKWVEPMNGIPQGNYVPAQLIVTPKQKQLVTIGTKYRLSSNLNLESELALSKNDINTFSNLDANDDFGKALKTKIIHNKTLIKNNNWNIENALEFELLGTNFNPIEQFRTVEFDRDWNTRYKGYKGNQLSTNGSVTLKNKRLGYFTLKGQHYKIGEDYVGKRTQFKTLINQNGFKADIIGSALSSQASNNNTYIRHKADISQRIGKLKIGYIDDHELNTFDSTSYDLALSSYQFFDYQFYISNGDSSKNNYRFFYRERYDQHSDSFNLIPVAKGTTIGNEIEFKNLKNHKLHFISSYRTLEIKDTNFIQQKPENNLLGRIDYDFKAFKNAISFNNFYEIGSGLELRKEFLYLQVAAGQGIYTWIDYNGDGIKDLNEFEIAQFQDQAQYIRIFTPSNQYTKTFSNELNQGLFIRPERVWSNEKGLKKFISRFSNQSRVRILTKTNQFNGITSFNPFQNNISDTALISTTRNLKNTFYFNRISSVFGSEFTFNDNRTKTLLSNGFDARQKTYKEIAFRWNIKRVFTLEGSVEEGTKIANADYTSGRNYAINYVVVKPSFIYQPSTSFRITFEGKISEKNNSPDLGDEKASVREIGTTIKYNKAEKGSLNGSLKMIRITYNGVQNSSLGFEMLEALKPGINYTWNIGYQRSISKTLQLSIQYTGRKSENNRMIHTGGMEVRAFF